MFKQLTSSLLKSTSTYCFKETVCYKRSTAKTLFKRRTTLNPGIQAQSALLTDKLDNKSVPVDDDEMESDFMNVGASYKEHQKEIATLADIEKVLIIKQKYFKDTFPNFLTWNDKKQIQYLHKANPDEWTIVKLSQGFPALPDTITKIVKATWSKKNSTKIINHDNAVKRNWELFKNGKLNLPPNLASHLSNFTNRNYNHKTQINENCKEITNRSTTAANGEFSEIIKSYECLKNNIPKCENHGSEPIQSHAIKTPTKEMYLTANIMEQHNHTTLKSLKNTLVFDASIGKELGEDDKLLLQFNATNSITNSNDTIEENYVIDLQDVSKTAYLTANNKKDSKHLIYPEKIVIPKEKLKKDCIYKLYDCYYDSDGLFLYRVPGMEK